MHVETRLSPNQNSRPGDVKPDLIVIHGTAGSDAGDRDWIMRPEAQVSYHVHVGRDGSAVCFVEDHKRAWHAGRSSWEGRNDCNDYSLGLGFGCYDHEVPSAAALRSGAEIVAGWMVKYGIPFSRVVGHCHVSPGRKSDPWLQFPWEEFLGLVLSYLAPRTGQVWK